MDPADYDRVLKLLDGEIEKAEKAKRRDEVERALRDHRKLKEALEAKIARLRTLGAGAPAEAASLLRRMEQEEAALVGELEKLPIILLPPPEPEPVRLPVPQRAKPLLFEEQGEFTALLREMDETGLAACGDEERWTLFEIWADRWRILVDRFGSHAAKDRIASAAYARIRGSMEEFAGENRPYIPALNEEKKLDWPERLREAQGRCAALAQRRRMKLEARRKMRELENLLGRDDLATEEAERRLRHAVRDIAREESLRGELADMVEPYRQSLGAEFDFLFQPVGAEDSKALRVKLSNRDILSRLLRRLANKGMIGEKYCPADMVPKGFPPHDAGRAKEAIRVLQQAGVLLSGKGGEVISLAPEWTARVREFLAGEPLGAEGVDAWSADERSRGPARLSNV